MSPNQLNAYPFGAPREAAQLRTGLLVGLNTPTGFRIPMGKTGTEHLSDTQDVNSQSLINRRQAQLSRPIKMRTSSKTG